MSRERMGIRKTETTILSLKRYVDYTGLSRILCEDTVYLKGVP